MRLASRSEDFDRSEDRTDDSELRAYNAMLASMAERDAKAPPRRR